jgi:hypothetical protein
MSLVLTQSLGWLATGIFVSSYLLRKSGALRGMQMCGAALWILYGFLIHAMPVIVANALVFAAAGATTLSAGRRLS